MRAAGEVRRGVGRVVHLEEIDVHEERLVGAGVRLNVLDGVGGLIFVEGGETVVGDRAEVLGRLARDAFPFGQIHVLAVIFGELRIVGRKPGMEPLVGVVVSVDAGVIGGEILHLVEAVLGRIGRGNVAHVPLAGKIGRIAVLLEELGNRRRFLAQVVRVARRDDDRQRRADRDPPRHERGASGRATRLAVPVGEGRAFLGDPVDVRRRMAERLAAAGIGAEIVPAGVVRHQHDDVRPFLRLGVSRRQRQRRQRRAYCASDEQRVPRKFIGHLHQQSPKIDRTLTLSVPMKSRLATISICVN